MILAHTVGHAHEFMCSFRIIDAKFTTTYNHIKFPSPSQSNIMSKANSDHPVYTKETLKKIAIANGVPENKVERMTEHTLRETLESLNAFERERERRAKEATSTSSSSSTTIVGEATAVSETTTKPKPKSMSTKKHKLKLKDTSSGGSSSTVENPKNIIIPPRPRHRSPVTAPAPTPTQSLPIQQSTSPIDAFSMVITSNSTPPRSASSASSSSSVTVNSTSYGLTRHNDDTFDLPYEVGQISQLCVSIDGRHRLRQGLKIVLQQLANITTKIEKQNSWLRSDMATLLDDEDRELFMHSNIEPLLRQQRQTISLIREVGNVLARIIEKQRRVYESVTSISEDEFIAPWKRKCAEMQVMHKLVSDYLKKF